MERWDRRTRAPGAIVLCFAAVGDTSSAFAALSVLLAANASAVIFAESTGTPTATDDLLPSVHVDLRQGTQILHYIRSSRNPTARIMPSRTAIGGSPAPSVAYFSSRGPSSVSPDILKPDVAAPGVNILAAWSPKSTPTDLFPYDRRSVNWNFNSGTSMACPHVSGVVALIRSVHPDWSPAMIKSALMTTAYTSDTSADRVLSGGTAKPADAFDVGAGHVDPLRAVDPGLVYDMQPRDYVVYLCSLGYSEAQIKSMLLPSPSVDTSCATARGQHSDLELNYPAITVSELRATVTVKRTLHNVGKNRHAVYFAAVISPQGVNTVVWPPLLIFSGLKEEASYYLTMSPAKRSQGRYDFGEITWSDGYHRVRSPLAVRVTNTDDGGPRPI